MDSDPNNFVHFFVFGAPLVMAQGATVRQYIGAPMFPSANRQC
jgi:hypothetical protein